MNRQQLEGDGEEWGGGVEGEVGWSGGVFLLLSEAVVHCISVLEEDLFFKITSKVTVRSSLDHT